MKKILILLMLCYSFAFSLTSVFPTGISLVYAKNGGSPCYKMGASTGKVSYLNNQNWSIDNGTLKFYKKNNYIRYGTSVACPDSCTDNDIYNETTNVCEVPPLPTCGPKQILNEENTGCIADPQYQGNCNVGFVDVGNGCDCPGGTPKFDDFSFYCPILKPLGVGDSPDTITDELNSDNPNETPTPCVSPFVFNFYGDCVSPDETYYNFPMPDVNTTVDPLIPLDPVTAIDSNNTDPALANTNNLLSNIRTDLKSLDNEAVKTNSLLTNVRTDIYSMDKHLKKQGVTFDEVLANIKKNGTEQTKANQLFSDMNSSMSQFKNRFGQWVDDDSNNSKAQLDAQKGTTVAINSQTDSLSTKLDEVIDAIKGDANGTYSNDGNGTINIDLNDTNAKLDQLHDDNNITNSLLSDIKDFFDNNSSDSVSGFQDSLPSDGWYESNKINVDVNNYSGDCYLETIMILDKYEFPPRSVIDMLPLHMLGNLFMAVLYLLGLRSFLRN